MIRQIALCLAFAFMVVLLGFGCGRGQRGVQVPDTQSEKDKEKATVPSRVEQMLGMIQDGNNPNRRERGAGAAGRIAGNPELTADQKAQLIDALKKAAETETDEGAKAAETEALAKLQGSGS